MCLVVWALAIRFSGDDYIYCESLIHLYLHFSAGNGELEYGLRSRK